MPKANSKNTKSRKTKHAKAAGAAKADPIYAAIDRHVEALKKHEQAITACGRLEGRRGKHKPGYAAANRKQTRLCGADCDARKAITTTRAKTIEGAAAARYLQARCIDDSCGGCDDHETQALNAFVRMTTALAPRAHSPAFLKVIAIIKRIEGERAKRHARHLKWRKSAAGKKQKARIEKLKKGPTGYEIEGQRKAIAIMRGFLAAIEPDSLTIKTFRKSTRKAA